MDGQKLPVKNQLATNLDRLSMICHSCHRWGGSSLKLLEYLDMALFSEV
jgi:hypothetical protein